MKRDIRTEHVRRKAVWGGRLPLAMALAGALALGSATSCSKAIRSGQASSYLILTSLTGGANATAPVRSDVVTDNGIFDDGGQAAFTLALKDELGPAPTAVNSITLTQYHVEYIRSDGRNTPGVDVPFAFDGGLGATISDTGSVNFTLVRIQAKLESPLKALTGHGGAEAISTVARITFYGHDQTGREVSVTGNIEVNFADWAG